MRLALLFAFALALPLAGCRDGLVDLPPDANPNAPGGVRSMYLKGSGLIALNETVTYRGEPFPNATYSWTYEGDAEVETADASSDRVFRLHGTRNGLGRLTMTAYVDGQVFAQTTRDIEVR